MVPSWWGITLGVLLFFVPAAARTQEPVRPTRTGEISGRVLDDCYEPVPGAEVTVLQRVSSPEEAVAARPPVTTNESGEFRVAGLAPGRYYVRATSLTPPDEAQVQYGTAYYPAAARTLPDAEAVEVGAGAVVSGVTINLWTVPLVPAAGSPGGLPSPRR